MKKHIKKSTVRGGRETYTGSSGTATKAFGGLGRLEGFVVKVAHSWTIHGALELRRGDSSLLS